MTDDAVRDLILAIRIDSGTVYQWRVQTLYAHDSSHPFEFSVAALTAAGATNDAALRAALRGSSVLRLVLADPNDSNIDWPKLQAITP